MSRSLPLAAREFAPEAGQCDVRPQFVHNLVRKTAPALLGRLGQVREEFEAHCGAYPILQCIEKIVNQQCQRIAKQ